MEIRCTECDHLGAAESVRPVDDGVGLVCSDCGHLNVVCADSNAEDGATDASADVRDGEVGLDENAGKKSSGKSSLFADFNATSVLSWTDSTDDGGDDDKSLLTIGDDFSENSKKRLIPEQGVGRRCRKCFHLLERDDLDHCARCGLNLEDAAAYEGGKAPWEKPPPGKEDAQRRAEQIWKAAQKTGESKTVDDFVKFVVDEELIDFGIRTVQQHLVDNPEDSEAIEALEELAQSLEVAIHIARTRAESQSDEFQNEIKSFRSRLLVGALIFWTVILLLFSWLFWGTF